MLVAIKGPSEGPARTEDRCIQRASICLPFIRLASRVIRSPFPLGMFAMMPFDLAPPPELEAVGAASMGSSSSREAKAAGCLSGGAVPVGAELEAAALPLLASEKETFVAMAVVSG